MLNLAAAGFGIASATLVAMTGGAQDSVGLAAIVANLVLAAINFTVWLATRKHQ